MTLSASLLCLLLPLTIRRHNMFLASIRMNCRMAHAILGPACVRPASERFLELFTCLAIQISTHIKTPSSWLTIINPAFDHLAR
jgi:hypothetical protein